MRIVRDLALSTVLLVAGVVSPALAADVLVARPAAAFNWSGAYVGGQVGGAFGDAHGEFTTDDSFNADPSGFIGGFYAGGNYQLPSRIVLGVDADFT